MAGGLRPDLTRRAHARDIDAVLDVFERISTPTAIIASGCEAMMRVRLVPGIHRYR